MSPEFLESSPEPPLIPRAATSTGPRVWALLPVAALALLLAFSLDDPRWLGPDSLEAPRGSYDSSRLVPNRRDWIRRNPPQGIALGVYSMDPTYDYEPMLREIAATGARWVELVVNHYQERYDSSSVGVSDARTAPWRQIRRTVEQAHALGLQVQLMPILLLRQPRATDWRGTIAPLDLDRWHRSYRAWIVDIARKADRADVEILCVGSELNSRQGDGEPWLETIASVRSVYHGAVTYSANWDSFDSVSFLETLDAIGLTTYYPLAQHREPTVDELIASWLPLRSELVRWQRTTTIPMIFTEVGYPSIDGAAMHPWDYTAEGDCDVLEQRDCLQAFASVWKDVPELTGLFFFHWWGRGGPLDRTYTPKGKPGLEVVERWFRWHRTTGSGEGTR